MKKITSFLLIPLSALLLTISFPNIFFKNFTLISSVVAFVSLIPLLLYIKQVNRIKGFFSGFICGTLFYILSIYWLIPTIHNFGNIPWSLSVIAILIICIYLAVYIGVFALCFKIFYSNSFTSLLLLSLIWTLLEIIRGTLISGFPWISLGYSQYLNIPFIQVCDIIGVYGLSGIIVFINLNLFKIISHLISKKSILKPVIVIILTMIIINLYGFFRLGYTYKKSATENEITISAIQPCVIPEFKRESQKKEYMFNRHIVLSAEAILDKDNPIPDIVLWSESSFPFIIEKNPRFLTDLQLFASQCNTNLIFGLVYFNEDFKLQNGAFHIDELGVIKERYAKIHLVPFGEYFPLRNFPIIKNYVGGFTDFSPGQKLTVFHVKNTSFSTVICYEIIFPELIARFAQHDIDFILNQTNDAWYGDTAGPYQDVITLIFRAVENRFPVIRAANNGISIFIDENGKIMSMLELNQVGVLTDTVKTGSKRSLFSKHYRLVYLFFFACFFILLLYTFIKNNKK